MNSASHYNFQEASQSNIAAMNQGFHTVLWHAETAATDLHAYCHTQAPLISDHSHPDSHTDYAVTIQTVNTQCVSIAQILLLIFVLFPGY